jgi:hypothetical protein
MTRIGTQDLSPATNEGPATCPVDREKQARLSTTSFSILLSVVAVFTTGCPQNAPKLDLRDSNYKSVMAAQLKDNVYKKEWIEFRCANDGYYNVSVSDTSFTPFSCGQNVKSPENAARIRNDVLDSGVALIDSVYGVYIRDLRQKRSVGEFLADILQIGGSTAGGIVNGQRALQVIGVALTGFTAVRKSASINFFDDKTTSVLIKQMDASRSQVIGEIQQLEAKPTTEYSFDAALSDIIRYFDVGTLNRAFTELDKQTSIQADIARKGVLKIKHLEDISALPTSDDVAINKDISDALVKLSSALKDENKAKAATATLKAVYDQIAKEDKFKEILDNLKAKKEPEYGELTEKTKASIESAFTKLGANPPQDPTGGEFHSLIIAVQGMASVQTGSGVIEKPELRKLILDYIKKAELK